MGALSGNSWLAGDRVNDQERIFRLFEDGDRALVSADVAEMKRIYADDYAQYDEAGVLSSRQEVIERVKSGQIRFVSMKSTGRRIRMLREDVAVVHGSEEDIVEQDGVRTTVRYVYLDVVMKHEGQWKIVASQLAKVIDR